MTHGHVLLLRRSSGLVDHLDWLLVRIVDHLRVARLEGGRSSSIGQRIGDRGTLELIEVEMGNLLLALVRHPFKNIFFSRI